jgi:murein DD-endopeptidase MepM/ murein hydrolase activator NlpD
MPAKGKHRRSRNSPISRGFIAASTGGAAIALPLLGATGAHAAPAAAPAVVPQTAPAAAHTARNLPAVQPGATTAAAARTTKTYTVVPGDYLSKIAEEQHVRGGWQRLYEDNRRVVGADPAMIHPGQRLAIPAGAAAAGSSETPAGKASPATGSATSTAEESPEESPEESKAPSAEAPTASKVADRTAAQSSASGFTLPVDAGVGTAYRVAGGNWSSGYHTGVDFLAPSGTTVKAVGAGTVVSAGDGGSYGNQIVIRHADGMYSQYAHLSSLAVSAGQSVTGGQRIGLSGATGNVTGPHLHFEIRTGPDYGADVDPLAYLREHGVSI